MCYYENLFQRNIDHGLAHGGIIQGGDRYFHWDRLGWSKKWELVGSVPVGSDIILLLQKKSESEFCLLGCNKLKKFWKFLRNR